jgi:hypothetical protein
MFTELVAIYFFEDAESKFPILLYAGQSTGVFMIFRAPRCKERQEYKCKIVNIVCRRYFCLLKLDFCAIINGTRFK